MMINKLCGNCEHTDGCVYTSFPPQVKCTITGEYHFCNDSCDINWRPVVHGEWIDYKDYPTYDDYYQCSICGVLSKGKFYFCSNCGADMRGVSDEPIN